MSKSIPLQKLKRLERLSRNCTDNATKAMIVHLQKPGPVSVDGKRVNSQIELKKELAVKLYSTADGRGLKGMSEVA